VIAINDLLIPDEIDHPGVFCHPDAFVIPTKEGSAIRAKAISSNESIFIDLFY